MMFGAAIAAAIAYLGLLFWLAAWQDRVAADGQAVGRAGSARVAAWLKRHSGIIFGLSLGVYCTSWTFFGGVGTAASAGLDFLPIYLGPILVFTFGFGLVRKILAQSKAQHSTSIADFLSARYGKSAGVAALVAIIATVGSLPYMALQLRSVGTSMVVLSPDLAGEVATNELVLLITGLMALFAILFGARRADHPGQNAGMVLTIALESAVKLVALFAVAALALVLLSGAGDNGVQAAEVFAWNQVDARFWTLTVIAGCATFCLPRQFHMTFIEAGDEKPDGPMYWTFPLYLSATALVIVPIVLAGLSVLPATTNPDTIVLALPLSQGMDALALLVFIGGFSASAGMIVVASVALSTMITNDLIAPVLFKSELSGNGDRTRIAERVLMTRRIVIAGLLLFAYLFYLGFGTLETLAGLGTLAFAAAAQFAPGLFLGMLSEAGNKAGMIAGLIVGFVLWLVLLIMPLALGSPAPFAIHPDPLVSGVFLSLGANTLTYWLVSFLYPPTLIDAAQAAAFAGTPIPGARARLVTNKTVADIRLLLAQFVGERRAASAISAMPGQHMDTAPADPVMIEMVERTISGVIGSSSARMLIHSWSGGDTIALPEVVAMFGETNKRLSFSGELLQIAIENIDQGIALVDAEMCLVAWNTRYQEMFDLPGELVSVGTPIAQLIRFNLGRTALRKDEIEAQVERRLAHMRAGREHRIESEQFDGRIMRIVGSPAPGGGYVTSYTDITADRRAEQALEEMVSERTQQLSEANKALEQATRSKTRFLAAASHDLIQPLNAARLFASALGEEVAGKQSLERLVHDLDGSIISADRLIRALLDISKLDSGGVEPKLESVAVDHVFDEIIREFSVQAKAKSVDLRRVRTSAWVETDRALFTSIVRNLVSNAVRYTDEGGILLGVRRMRAKGGRNEGSIQVCVHDTGRGIAPKDQAAIFDEFNRGPSTDREGLGLGLAIVRRTARLLDIHVETTSKLGSGSRFALTVQPIAWRTPVRPVNAPMAAKGIAPANVLVIDNDPAVLSATCALLEKWGLHVTCAASFAEAEALCATPPDVVVMDYRLDGDERGDGVYGALCEGWQAKPPAILLTAEASQETEIAAETMGATRLLKPSSPAALRALVSKCIADNELKSQTAAQSATG